ncbi:MAG TPA: helix-turn-helix domain-containing protein [Chthonomonadaceae bacterium]|nr:helix-turn-helix domain-containing protein [Chthonomonadaceae bacterium]
MQTQAPQKLLLDIETAAEKLSLSRSHVYRLVAEGRLPVVVIGRNRRIPAMALEQFVEERLQPSREVK